MIVLEETTRALLGNARRAGNRTFGIRVCLTVGRGDGISGRVYLYMYLLLGGCTRAPREFGALTPTAEAVLDAVARRASTQILCIK